MKHLHSHSLITIAIGIAISIVNVSASQKITNAVNISITTATQQYPPPFNTIAVTPKPAIKTYFTKDIIAQISKSFPQIATNGAILQAVSPIDANEDIVVQVRNTNGFIVDVTSLFKVTPSTEDIYYGTYNNTNGAMKATNIGPLTVAYDDRAVNLTNGMYFSFYGIVTSQHILSPTPLSNTYKVTQSASLAGAVGEGYYTDGIMTNRFVITKSSFIIVTSNSIFVPLQP